MAPDPAALTEPIFARSGRAITFAQTDTVLRVAKSAALDLPSGCNFGVCKAGRVRKTVGRVHMVHNGGITEDAIAGG